MVNRGHQTALGQYADEHRWFPPVEGRACFVPEPEPPDRGELACTAGAAPHGLWSLVAVLAIWRRRRRTDPVEPCSRGPAARRC